MNELPFISAKCITYGRTELLEEAIYSFLIQDYPKDRCELVIVNDYPLQKLHYPHPQIKIYNLEQTFDVIGDKENYAIELCQGELIAVWDDDDIALSNHLSNIAKYWEPGANLLHWQKGVLFNSKSISALKALGNSGIVYSKKAWLAIGKSPIENAGGDMTLVLALKRLGHTVLASPPDEECSWFYYWANRSYHQSGQGRDTDDRDSIVVRHKRHIENLRVNGKMPTGDIHLRPNWEQPYDELLREYVERSKPAVLKGLVYITNYEGKDKLEYVNKILEHLTHLDAELDIIIYSTDGLEGLVTHSLNVDVQVKPKVFSNSIYAAPWQPEPEFIWLYREDIIAKVDQYDVFMHLEDDIAFNKDNFEQFVKYNYGEYKLEGYIVGNILYEQDNGRKFLPQFHKHYRGVGEVLTLNGERFVKPKNLHQASLIISKEQLKLLIKEGKFGSFPDVKGGYNIKCTAMTEPYCSGVLTKVVPIDDIGKSLTEHLTGKYAKVKDRHKGHWAASCQYLEDIEKELLVGSPNLNQWAISQELCTWIYNNLEIGSTILELGSGSGTKELTKRYKVHSVEHDSRWLGHAKDSNYIHAPLVDYGEYKWYSKEALKVIETLKYDLIIVDGPPGNIGRKGLVENLSMFDTSVIMIMDDVNRGPEASISKQVALALGKEEVIYKGYEKSFAVLK